MSETESDQRASTSDKGASESDSRPHALDIYERVCEDTEEELERPVRSLAFSGLFAGLTIGLAPIAYALASVALGDGGSQKLVAALFYPIGYVAVILGRSQFFTENTLYPVMLTLRRTQFLRATARLWAVVFTTNLIGAFLFALLAVTTGAFDDSVQSEFVANGVDATEGPFVDTFWSAVVTGFLLALVAWLVEGTTTSPIGQISVIWILTFLVALGSFDHSIATTVTAFGSLLDGELGGGALLGWLSAAVLGNVVGGVFIVAAINYGQVREED